MAQSRSEYEDGVWDECEALAGADDANILANTPLLLLTLPLALPLDVEEALVAAAAVGVAVAGQVAATGGCETPGGFSGKSVEEERF